MPPGKCRNNCRWRIAGVRWSFRTASWSISSAHRGKADEKRGTVPFVAGSAASPLLGDATLLGSRLALSVSSTLDVANAIDGKNQYGKAPAPRLRVTLTALQ